MSHCASLTAVVLFLGSHTQAWGQDKAVQSPRKPADGVYAVQRDGLKEKDVLPLKDGEMIVVHRHRYLKKDEKEPPRFLVVRSAPDVALEFVGAPKVARDEAGDLRIHLKLQPKEATTLERLTRAHLNRQIAIVLGGEVVTMHKVREVIQGGEVQITSCAPGAADYLLQQLQAKQKRK
jgi:preprotein translocase subunit SecD